MTAIAGPHGTVGEVAKWDALSCAAANQAAANEIAWYDELASAHIFYPVTIESGGTWNHWAVELDQEIGRRATFIIGEHRDPSLISAAVNSPQKGKCGRLPQHL